MWQRKPILSKGSRWISLEGFSGALGAGLAKLHAIGTEVQWGTGQDSGTVWGGPRRKKQIYLSVCSAQAAVVGG